MFIYIFVIVYIAACLYLRWQLIWWMKKTEHGSRLSAKPLAVAFGILDMIPILGAFLPESVFQATLQKFGNCWVGLIISCAVCLVIAHPLKYLIKPVTPFKAYIVMLVVVAFSIGFNMYGFIHAQEIYTHYYAVELSPDGAELKDEMLSLKTARQEGYPEKPDGNVTRVAVLADMHMGVNTQYHTISDIVNAVNDSGADCVIGAGDYFTSSYVGLFRAGEIAELLSTMSEPCNGRTYFAYGNHDVTEPLFCGFAIREPSEVFRYEDMDKFFSDCKWNMLGDEGLTYNGIQFFFRKDKSKTGDGRNDRASVKELLKAADRSKPIVVVQHEPEELDELVSPGVDLEISGHTHDGQIWPGNLFTRAVSENSHGYKDVDGMASIVSSGAGYFGPPLRIGTHSEVVVIDLIQK